MPDKKKGNPIFKLSRTVFLSCFAFLLICFVIANMFQQTTPPPCLYQAWNEYSFKDEFRTGRPEQMMQFCPDGVSVTDLESDPLRQLVSDYAHVQRVVNTPQGQVFVVEKLSDPQSYYRYFAVVLYDSNQYHLLIDNTNLPGVIGSDNYLVIQTRNPDYSYPEYPITSRAIFWRTGEYQQSAFSVEGFLTSISPTGEYFSMANESYDQNDQYWISHSVYRTTDAQANPMIHHNEDLTDAVYTSPDSLYRDRAWASDRHMVFKDNENSIFIVNITDGTITGTYVGSFPWDPITNPDNGLIALLTGEIEPGGASKNMVIIDIHGSIVQVVPGFRAQNWTPDGQLFVFRVYTGLNAEVYYTTDNSVGFWNPRNPVVVTTFDYNSNSPWSDSTPKEEPVE